MANDGLKQHYSKVLEVSVRHLESVFATSSIKDEVYVVAVNRSDGSLPSAAKVFDGKFYVDKNTAITFCGHSNAYNRKLVSDSPDVYGVYKVYLEIVEKVG